MILKGLSGAGKTTFANTIGLFRDGVTVLSIDGNQDLAEALQRLPVSEGPRIVVVSGREALGEVSHTAVEQFLHAINTFVRSAARRETLIIWPVNTQGLAESLGKIADELGAEALLGVGDKIHTFTGPAPDKYTVIAERTIGALNEGASLVNLGITDDERNKSPKVRRQSADTWRRSVPNWLITWLHSEVCSLQSNCMCGQ